MKQIIYKDEITLGGLYAVVHNDRGVTAFGVILKFNEERIITRARPQLNCPQSSLYSCLQSGCGQFFF